MYEIQWGTVYVPTRVSFVVYYMTNPTKMLATEVQNTDFDYLFSRI